MVFAGVSCAAYVFVVLLFLLLSAQPNYLDAGKSAAWVGLKCLFGCRRLPYRRYSFRLTASITFRANPFFGSEVTDNEGLHPLNYARLKDGISSVSISRPN